MASQTLTRSQAINFAASGTIDGGPSVHTPAAGRSAKSVAFQDFQYEEASIQQDQPDQEYVPPSADKTKSRERRVSFNGPVGN